MGSRTKVVDTGLDGTTFDRKIKAVVATYALAATGTIDKSAPMVHFIDPNGGARNIKLPANSDSKGLMFIVYNTSDATSGEAITFKTATGAGLTKAAVLELAEGCLLVNDGNGWASMMVGANT